MNKEFITCLEHIIDLEKTRMAQERLVNDMTYKANKLGLHEQIQKPFLKKAVLRKEKTDDSGVLFFGVYVASAIILGSIFSWIRESIGPFFFMVFIGGPAVACAITLPLSRAKDRRAEQQAQENYEAEVIENQRIYQDKMILYNMEVEADEQRVMNELIVKDNILQSIEDLKTQLRRTEDTLKTYYDAAGIYDSNAYRNIVAVCYYHEYLASGICTELGGATGAYITYKNEMYSRMNIERLDTIINYLDRLHQDNQILNESLHYVASCVNDVSRRMDTVITQQKTVTDRLDAHSRQVSGQLEEVTVQLDDIWRQGALSLYMQSCEEQNLNYLAWMEFSKARLK